MAGWKVNGLRDYRFELIIENEDAEFFSEKLIDSMLCGCIPIYWNTHDTSYLDMFDKEGIIFFQDDDELFDMLENGYFTEELYLSKLESVHKNFDIAKDYISLGDMLWDYGIKDLIGTK